MNWFNNLKVAYKIFIGCVLLILMLVSVVSFSVISMRSTERTVREYRESSVLPIIRMDSIAKNLLQARINMYAAYVAFSENNNSEIGKRLEDTKKLREDNLELLKEVKNRNMSEEEKTLTVAYEKLHQELGVIMNNYIMALKSGNKNKISESMDSWLEKFVHVRQALAELHEKTIEVGAGRITGEFANMNKMIIYMIAIMGISVFTGMLITYLLSRSISRPVNMGLEFARKIAKGDFTERINIDRGDELGMLAGELNKAADNLEHIVIEIISSSNNLSSAVEQIAAGNQNLSQRTNEQASALEEVASTIEEANSSINQNYENSTQANKLSEESSGVALLGGKLVEEAVLSINEVNTSAKRIGEIISVIDEIAFQTNLLALNAAVEAARAGDQGRGFAVVAGEVRNLAQRAGNSSKEIAQLINDTVAKIENGTEKTYKSGESLREIIDSVKNVANVVNEIAASSNEQRQGMDQISIAITDLDSMTQHNAALVEETAAASEEMANQAQELMALMSQFKVRKKKGNEVIRDLTESKHKMAEKVNMNGGKSAGFLAEGKNVKSEKLDIEDYEIF